jgi:hypothetical protein
VLNSTPPAATEIGTVQDSADVGIGCSTPPVNTEMGTERVGHDRPSRAREDREGGLDESPSLSMSGQLQVGSSNPHLLEVDADRAPRRRKGATFDPLAHLPAEEEDLRSRALPACNIPPETDPLSPLESS